MSATLSTLSSGMNSMAAATYEDFLKHRIDHKISDAQATAINKGFVLFYGLLSTGLAFAAEPLGGVLRMCISVMGALSGPFVGIFVLAMFWPRAGFLSTIISFTISNILMIIVCMMNYAEDPYKHFFLPTNSTYIFADLKRAIYNLISNFDLNNSIITTAESVISKKN
ncbi:unnamed protein product [Anisakis simplex]|uniref:Sodium-coupled monocarboxylate transporter 2 n=1 Tax=Anisakis simplex TaxID=6269 RepID=A0A0M3JBE2_ANISI|nr:unnamed protein product [Anisakis simplex]